MVERLWCGKPATIAFTCDFHELVTGDLRRGQPLLLRYDPLRIVPADEPYRFGDPARPVLAHLQFHDRAPPAEVVLQSPAGVVACPDIDPTGQGSMLWADVDVPADAEQLVVWFSFAAGGGTVRYDSDYGANFRFGFASRDIDNLHATVTRRPGEAADLFEIGLDAAAGIEAVSVPFLVLGDPSRRHELGLRPVAIVPGDRRWAASHAVPRGAVVRYKVCYWVGGRRMIDDNAAAWYLVPEPVAEPLPPPPAALLKAAASWS